MLIWNTKVLLHERLFRVEEADRTSLFLEIKSGIPQGSVLGPALYLHYTADLPEINSATSAIFADNTAILTNSKDPTTVSYTLPRWNRIRRNSNKLLT